ncbi:MAG: cytochrome c5 family protein [Exilibacterium sp.]
MSHLKKIVSLVSAMGLGIVVSATAFAASEVTDAIKERIQPEGQICMAGDDCAGASMVLAVAEGPRSGETIYQSKCLACHGSGVAGAPKFGDAAQWGPRVSQGIDTLYSHALNGLNAMPPKGLCMDCSEEEIHGAVDYMVENSK